jgi:hypothetical protein
MKKVFRVAVEGIADKRFWDRVFRREFTSGRVEFHVRQFGGRASLIASAAEFLALSRDQGYFRTLFLLDRHRDPCITAVLEQFPAEVAQADDVEILVSVPGIEAWYLADSQAIRRVLPGVTYDPPAETAGVNPKAILDDLLVQFDPSGRTKYKKTYFSTQVGRHFSPKRGAKHNTSLTRAWSRTELLVEDP